MTNSEYRSRLITSLFFFISALALGLPIWVYTTTIDRSLLPDQLQIKHIKYNIAICVAELPEPLANSISISSIIENSQILINDKIKVKAQQSEKSLFDFNVEPTISLHYSNCPPSAYPLQFSTGSSTFDYKLGRGKDRNIEIFTPFDGANDVNVSHYLADALFKIFNSEFDRLYQDSNSNNNMKMDYSPNYKLSLSLLHQSASGIEWNLNSEPFKAFEAFIHSLSQLTHFTLSSQIGWYSQLPQTPGEYFVNSTKIIKDTSNFIDYSGWGLDQDVELDPVINLIIYIPDKMNPIEIEKSNRNAFVVPQWGGVVIYNPSKLNNNDEIPLDDFHQILEIWASQLFQLIGGGTDNSIFSLYFRIDQLTRLQTIENIAKTIDNVSSLKKLTQQMETIPIPKKTAIEIEQAINSIKFALESIELYNWADALTHSSNGLTLSDKAFFQKDMLQQAYFPDEHKLAVYSPLIAPMATIIILGLIGRLKERKVKSE